MTDLFERAAGGRPRHCPGDDFNDDLLPIRVAFRVTPVEDELRAAGSRR